MCGITGYTGKKPAFERVIEGLEALEYRGYDSAGVALATKDTAAFFKQAGRVKNTVESAAKDTLTKKATLGIGHTRWATHGQPNTQNAHPHTNTDETIFVVHNGIIENYQEIKSMLVDQGYVFKSETDTEVIPHLIDFHAKTNTSFERAVVAALQDLHGAFAVAIISSAQPDTIFAARLSSPLVVGIGNGEHFIASDPTAIMKHTKKVIFLNDYDLAVIKPSSLKVQNIKSAKSVTHTPAELDFDIEQAKLGDYEHFMIKEIFETPDTVRAATRGRVRPSTNTVKLGGLQEVAEQLQYIDRIVIVACGTSYYAGLVGEYLIEEIAGIPVEVQLASEFKYRDEPFSRSTALLAISQSGETADTIAAIKKVEGYGVLKLGIVNAVGSTISRITDAGVYCHAGPEQSVASTKAFVAQVTVLIEMALALSDGKSQHFSTILNELSILPDKLSEVLSDTAPIKKLAKKYSKHRDFLFIGRKYLYPTALEGALKLKEVSYIHAEGSAAGEMKHGPLAMIDNDFATLALLCDGPLMDKTLSNIEEIRARKGPVLAIATVGNSKVSHLTKDVLYIPQVSEQLQPIIAGVVLQLFAYYVAAAKGLDVDRPRNLAKSVTVE